MTERDATVVGRSGLVVTLNAARIKTACVERGWSLSELARRAKVSRPTLRSALAGNPIRPLTAWKVARALASEPPLRDLLEAA